MNILKNPKISTFRLGNLLKIIMRAIFVLGIGFIILYPVLYLISNAFKDPVDLLDRTIVWIPKTFTLENFNYAFRFLDYKNSILQTIKITVPSVIFQLISCTMAGYGFARFKFRGRSLMFACVIFTIIVPAQTIIIPLYTNYRYFDFFGLSRIVGLFTGEAPTVNLLNTAASFYVPSAFGVGIRSGLYIFIFRQFFRGMPKELEDAAKIDGCGAFSTFIKVMLPNAVTSVLTVMLFSIVWHYNDYYLSAFLFDKDFTLSVAMANVLVLVQPNTIAPGMDLNIVRDSIQECASLLSIAPILIIYIVTQKYFTESIERTGIVG